jgi:hypothetical protein
MNAPGVLEYRHGASGRDERLARGERLGQGDRNFFEGDARTAALGSFNMPTTPNSSAAPIVHSELSPSQSRRGTGSGSRRERGGVDLVVIGNSIQWCRRRAPS